MTDPAEFLVSASWDEATLICPRCWIDINVHGLTLTAASSAAADHLKNAHVVVLEQNL